MAQNTPFQFLPNSGGLGTPMHGESIKQIRREKIYDRIFRCSALLVAVLIGAAIGYNAKMEREAPPAYGDSYRTKQTRLVPGSRLCEMDQHEGCLVCMHEDIRGQASISHHC